MTKMHVDANPERMHPKPKAKQIEFGKKEMTFTPKNSE